VASGDEEPAVYGWLIADGYILFICIVFVFFRYSRSGGPISRKIFSKFKFCVASRCGATG
jgi:hypothetical protein